VFLNLEEIVMKNLYSGIQRFIRDEEGVTAIEYALIAALIAVVIIAAVRAVGQDVNNTFQAVANALT
jgi:pilus assembly protein Flp/PilA